MSRHDIFALSIFAETNVCSSVRNGISVDFDVRFRCLEFFRMEDVEYGARVVNWWEWEFIIGEIHSLIHLEHIVYSLGKGDVLKSFEMIKYILGGHIFMGHFQRDHH